MDGDGVPETPGFSGRTPWGPSLRVLLRRETRPRTKSFFTTNEIKGDKTKETTQKRFRRSERHEPEGVGTRRQNVRTRGEKERGRVGKGKGEKEGRDTLNPVNVEGPRGTRDGKKGEGKGEVGTDRG